MLNRGVNVAIAPPPHGACMTPCMSSMSCAPTHTGAVSCCAAPCCAMAISGADVDDWCRNVSPRPPCRLSLSPLALSPFPRSPHPPLLPPAARPLAAMHIDRNTVPGRQFNAGPRNTHKGYASGWPQPRRKRPPTASHQAHVPHSGGPRRAAECTISFRACARCVQAHPIHPDFDGSGRRCRLIGAGESQGERERARERGKEGSSSGSSRRGGVCRPVVAPVVGRV